MTLKAILKDLNLSNSKTHYKNGNYTKFTLTYDYKPFFEKWNEIYEKMNKKTISRLEDYIDPYKFICDFNRVMFAGINKINSKSYSCKYIKYNENLIYDYANKILENIFDNGFMDKYNEPYIFLKESNNWEKEVWFFGININKNNINKIMLLKEKLNILFSEKKEFSIGYEIKNYNEIKSLPSNTGYFNKYNIIDKYIDFDLLLTLNKEQLNDKLYKGGLFR